MSTTGSKITMIIVAVLSLAMLGLLAVGFVNSLEKVEKVLRTPPKGEARSNQVLAAERFLERMGVDAESATTLDEMPSPDHVLILAMEERVLTQARADRLLDWVSEGGYLIVGPHLRNGVPTAETDKDLLLVGLDIFVENYEGEFDTDREALEMEGLDSEQEFEVRFFSGFGLGLYTQEEEEEEEEWFTYAVVWGDYDNGRYVVVNDLRFMHNDEIGDLDHAAYLWHLVGFGGQREGVLLVHGWGAESMWAMILRHGWPALLLGAMLLASWLWRVGARFGPILAEPRPGSRSLMEHVDAIGYFLWRTGRQDTLVEDTRRALSQRIALCRPGFTSLSRKAQNDILEHGSDLPRTRIHRSFFGPVPRKREPFTRAIRTLEQLRRDL